MVRQGPGERRGKRRVVTLYPELPKRVSSRRDLSGSALSPGVPLPRVRTLRPDARAVFSAGRRDESEPVFTQRRLQPVL